MSTVFSAPIMPIGVKTHPTLLQQINPPRRGPMRNRLPSACRPGPAHRHKAPGMFGGRLVTTALLVTGPSIPTLDTWPTLNLRSQPAFPIAQHPSVLREPRVNLPRAATRQLLANCRPLARPATVPVRARPRLDVLWLGTYGGRRRSKKAIVPCARRTESAWTIKCVTWLAAA